MKNTKRCFVCITFPREVSSIIIRIQKELEGSFIGKFTEEKNLHLTLKFLGEIDNETIEKVRERLRGISFDEFNAELGELGVFSKKFIRIVWIKILGEKLISLQREIDEKLSDIFEKEYRFMGHLTIARVKKIDNKRLFLDKIKKIKPANKKFKIKKFYLNESITTPEGPIYKVMEEFKLG